LQVGALVWVEAPRNSAGGTTYPHFFVVLTLPDWPRVGDLIPLVGITSRVSSENLDPAKHVTMKWLNRRGGDPETGFTKPCVADVTFTHVLEVEAGAAGTLEVDAEFAGKFIRADKLHTIVALVNARARR
jgi:hypothetical protein